MKKEDMPQWVKELQEKEGEEYVERVLENIEALKTTEIEEVRTSGVYHATNHEILQEVYEALIRQNSWDVLGLSKDIEEVLDGYLKEMIGWKRPKYRETEEEGIDGTVGVTKLEEGMASRLENILYEINNMITIARGTRNKIQRHKDNIFGEEYPVSSRGVDIPSDVLDGILRRVQFKHGITYTSARNIFTSPSVIGREMGEYLEKLEGEGTYLIARIYAEWATPQPMEDYSEVYFDHYLNGLDKQAIADDILKELGPGFEIEIPENNNTCIVLRKEKSCISNLLDI